MDAIAAFRHDLKHCPRYTREEERALWQRMRDGDREASGLLYQSILPMVWGIVAYKRGDLEEATLDCTDAIMVSLKNFNPDKGRLTTYATWAARTQRIKARQRAEKRPCAISLDTYAAECSLAEKIEDVVQSQAEQAAEQADADKRTRYLEFLLSHLGPRDLEAVTRGFRGEKLHETGARMGVCKERVRQIESRGLKQLKAAAASWPFSLWEKHMDQEIRGTNGKDPFTLADALGALKAATPMELEREIRRVEHEVLELAAKIEHRQKIIRLLKKFAEQDKASVSRPPIPAGPFPADERWKAIHKHLAEKGPARCADIAKHFLFQPTAVHHAMKRREGSHFRQMVDKRWEAIPVESYGD